MRDVGNAEVAGIEGLKANMEGFVMLLSEYSELGQYHFLWVSDLCHRNVGSIQTRFYR